MNPQLISVWPGLAPGEQTASPGAVLDDDGGNVTRLTAVTGPELFVYGVGSPDPRPAVVVCPGGGYHILATDIEGIEVAQWLNTLGCAAVILHYRVPENRDGALQDGQRAISLLRSRASELGILPGAVGVLGFSAGGHLAVRMAVTGASRTYAPVDETDVYGCGPDFALAIYPAYLTDYESGQVMPEVAPHSAMPPLFLAQSRDDDHLCAPAYAEAALQAGVSIEAKSYDSGGHGYGVRLAPDIPASQWQADAARWLQRTVAPA